MSKSTKKGVRIGKTKKKKNLKCGPRVRILQSLICDILSTSTFLHDNLRSYKYRHSIWPGKFINWIFFSMPSFSISWKLICERILQREIILLTRSSGAHVWKEKVHISFSIFAARSSGERAFVVCYRPRIWCSFKILLLLSMSEILESGEFCKSWLRLRKLFFFVFF